MEPQLILIWYNVIAVLSIKISVYFDWAGYFAGCENFPVVYYGCTISLWNRDVGHRLYGVFEIVL